jgi:hypothetical protein
MAVEQAFDGYVAIDELLTYLDNRKTFCRAYEFPTASYVEEHVIGRFLDAT